MNVLLETAHAYASRGWPVLPLQGKRPHLTNGVLGASRHPRVIEVWWHRWPEANVGIRTGSSSNLLVLDIDQDQGKQSLDALEQAHDFLLTKRVKTGRGEHYYFQCPSSAFRNRIGIRPGIDARAERGYVLAPPSLHPSGKQYEWDEDSESFIAPLPPWLINLLLVPTPKQHHVFRSCASGSHGDVARFWLEKYLSQAVPGRRNLEGFNLACQLRDAGFSESEAEPIIAEYAGRAPGEDYTEQEALRSLRSAYARPRRRPAGRWYIR